MPPTSDKKPRTHNKIPSDPPESAEPAIDDSGWEESILHPGFDDSDTYYPHIRYGCYKDGDFHQTALQHLSDPIPADATTASTGIYFLTKREQRRVTLGASAKAIQQACEQDGRVAYTIVAESDALEENILQSILVDQIPRENLPSHWETKKLKEIGEIYSGGTPKRDNEEYFGGDIPWVRLKDAKEAYVSRSNEYITQKGLANSSAQLLPEGTVIVSTRATIGEVTISKKEVTTNQGFKSVYPENDVPEFIAYYLLSITEEMEQLGRTTTYPEVNKTQFSNIEIPTPPIEEQKEIVQRIRSMNERLITIEESSSRKREILASLTKSVLNKAFSGSLSNELIEFVKDTEKSAESDGVEQQTQLGEY